MSNISDLRWKAAKARQQADRQKKSFLNSRAYAAMVWKDWRGSSRFGKLEAITHAYERNPAYYAAANIVASTVADTPIYVEYQKRGVMDTTTSHPILSMIDRGESREELIKRIVLYLVVTGESYMNIVFSMTADQAKRRPLGLVCLPSQYVTPIYTNEPGAPIQKYEFFDKRKVDFDPDEIIAVLRPSLSKPLEGMSPALPLSDTIDLSNAGVLWNKNVALGGGIPPVVASAPMGMDEQEAKKIQEAYMRQAGAENAHILKILSGDLDLKNFSTTPHDAEWEKAILMAMRVILMALGVSSSLMNDAANKTYNNVKDSRKALYLDASLPIADMVYKAISRGLRRYYDDNPLIKPDRSAIEALQEDQKAQAERLSELKLSGIISANEARSVLKWPKSKEQNADLLVTSRAPSAVKPPDDPVNTDNTPVNGENNG